MAIIRFAICTQYPRNNDGLEDQGSGGQGLAESEEVRMGGRAGEEVQSPLYYAAHGAITYLFEGDGRMDGLVATLWLMPFPRHPRQPLLLLNLVVADTRKGRETATFL